MSWFEPIDFFCERVGPGLWGEPLNMLSNLIGFYAAWLIWRAGRGQNDAAFPLMAGLIALVAAGTHLTHMFATNWAYTAETGTIAAFVLATIYLAVTRLMALPDWAGLGTMAVLPVVFFGFGILADRSFGPLNGAASFLPILVLMAGFSLALRLTGNPGSGGIAVSALIFAGSQVFLGLDMQVCPAWPFGTHFLWHLGGGILLWHVAKVVLTSRPPPAPA